MSAFGIDLGTTYSCISYLDDTGMPVVVKNLIGEDATPSVVYFQAKDRVVVGLEAKDAAKTDPDLVVSLIKRHMGVRAVELEFHGVTYTPESVSAFILRDLVRFAGTATGQDVRDVVITVPAYFGLAERQATQVAGEMAGLNVMSLVPEPVAAAMHYGVIDPGSSHTVLVYDLGGGTFDTTVMQLAEGDVNVVCTDGDHRLGGADWDERIGAYLQECFAAEYPDSGAGRSEEFLQNVSLTAEQLKVSLSQRQSRRQPLHFAGLKMTAEITRAVFEARTADLLDLTFDITQRTLETARPLGVDQVDKVLLVGGSTIMPAVARGLRDRFGFEPLVHDPHLAVAKGAAMFAFREAVRQDLGKSADSAADAEVTALARQLEMPPEVVGAAARSAVSIVVPRAFGVAVVAKGTDPTVAEAAIADVVTTDLLAAIEGSDLIIFSTPVEVMGDLAKQIVEKIDPQCIITDVGSVKVPVEKTMAPIFVKRGRWLGSHPMAGSEQSGLAAARARNRWPPAHGHHDPGGKRSGPSGRFAG